MLRPVIVMFFAGSFIVALTEINVSCILVDDRHEVKNGVMTQVASRIQGERSTHQLDNNKVVGGWRHVGHGYV